MQVHGTKTVHLTPGETYQLLTDPDVLARAMPGLKRLTVLSEHQYEGELEVGVAGIKGHYKSQIELTDVVPEESYRMLIHGEGPMGFLEANVALSLTQQGEDCLIAYDGDATVGGTVAGVGQRVLAGVAKLLIGQFFNGIAREAAALR